MRIVFGTCLWVGVLLLAAPVALSDADDFGPAVNAKGDPIDPKHKFESTVKNKDPRYYVWHETDSGWNLRCAALPGTPTKFGGVVEIVDGTFDRMRAVGLEKGGKAGDSWQLDAERKKLTFQITTKGSFDGFEFTTKGGPEARVRFALRVAGKPQADRIFIGKEGERPRSNRFSFAARP